MQKHFHLASRCQAHPSVKWGLLPAPPAGHVAGDAHWTRHWSMWWVLWTPAHTTYSRPLVPLRLPPSCTISTLKRTTLDTPSFMTQWVINRYEWDHRPCVLKIFKGSPDRANLHAFHNVTLIFVVLFCLF